MIKKIDFSNIIKHNQLGLKEIKLIMYKTAFKVIAAIILFLVTVNLAIYMFNVGYTIIAAFITVAVILVLVYFASNAIEKFMGDN